MPRLAAVGSAVKSSGRSRRCPKARLMLGRSTGLGGSMKESWMLALGFVGQGVQEQTCLSEGDNLPFSAPARGCRAPKAPGVEQTSNPTSLIATVAPKSMRTYNTYSALDR